MSASVEGNIIADVMSKKPNVKITRFPAIIRIDGERMLEFDMEEIGEALGLEPGEYSVYDFEIETSTHYGKGSINEERIICARCTHWILGCQQGKLQEPFR